MPVTKYPEDSFAWYMEGDKLAIVYIDSGVSYCSLSDYTNKQDCEDAGGSWYSGGKSSTGEYDTYDGATKGDAIRVHYHWRYNKIQHIEDDLKEDIGLDEGLHHMVLDYVKSRLLEDAGALEQAQYFKQKYDIAVKRHPLRKSSIRGISVPRI